MTIGEKVSYIKGLAQGLKVDDSTNEGKILGAILDVSCLQLEDTQTNPD